MRPAAWTAWAGQQGAVLAAECSSADLVTARPAYGRVLNGLKELVERPDETDDLPQPGCAGYRSRMKRYRVWL